MRESAQVHTEEFKECVSIMAQYIFDRFGKFPGTVGIFILTYLQAHHLELEFYDHHFGPGGVPANAGRPHGPLAWSRRAFTVEPFSEGMNFSREGPQLYEDCSEGGEGAQRLFEARVDGGLRSPV